jgi:hypothetical protein
MWNNSKTLQSLVLWRTCIVGCITNFVRLIIIRESPCLRNERHKRRFCERVLVFFSLQFVSVTVCDILK